MSEEDVKVAAQEVVNTEAKAETKETEVKETSQEPETEKPQETAEQKAERLERAQKAMQEKIDRQTAAYNAVQRTLQQRTQEYEQKLASYQAKPEEKEPSLEDFDSLDEFHKARDEYVAKKARNEYEKEIAQKQMAEAQAKLLQEREAIRTKQEAEYLEINPTYENSKAEVAAFLQISNASEAVAKAIEAQAFKGNVPALIDYFGANNGENLGELQEILRMSPVEAAVEIYKVQQKIGTPKKKEEKPAPKPVKSLAGSGKTVQPLSADLSYEELKKRLAKK